MLDQSAADCLLILIHVFSETPAEQVSRHNQREVQKNLSLFSASVSPQRLYVGGQPTLAFFKCIFIY